MSPETLLGRARTLVDRADPDTAGLWARAAAVLARQALEAELEAILRELAPGSQTTPFRTQLLCLVGLHPDRELAREVAYTWSALSEATHYHAYELAPTAAELRGWIEAVDAFVRDRSSAACPARRS